MDYSSCAVSALTDDMDCSILPPILRSFGARWPYFAQAEELEEDTLARRRRILGEDHPDTLAVAHRVKR